MDDPDPGWGSQKTTSAMFVAEAEIECGYLGVLARHARRYQHGIPRKQAP